MSEAEKELIRRIQEADVSAPFRCAEFPALGQFFARHALPNDQAGISRVYVLRPGTPPKGEEGSSPPRVLGYYTLSMASVEADRLQASLARKLPRYPMPVALIGRLAVDDRVRGRGYGETLLIDALEKVVEASDWVACLGIIVDAKDERAERFYLRYDFRPIESSEWPHRLFLPIGVAKAVFFERA